MHEERNIKYPDGKTLETVRQEFEQALNDLRLSGESRDQRLAQLEQDMISMQSAIAAKQSYDPGPPPGAGGDSELATSANLNYLGAFRLPTGQFGTDNYHRFSYSDGIIAYSPTGNSNAGSLYISSHAYSRSIAEITIPTIVNDATIGNLNTATVLQNFRTITLSDMGGIDDTNYIGGLYVDGNNVYGTVYEFYDGNLSASKAIFRLDSLTLDSANVTGLYDIGDLNGGFYAGYFASVPSAYQASIGKNFIIGQSSLAVTGRSSNGPAAFGFNFSDLSLISTTPVNNLVYYPGDHPLGSGWGTTNSYWNGTTHIVGACFVPNKRSLLFFGDHGTGTFCYGTPSECSDPYRDGKGCHSVNGEYEYQVWAYDINDLVSVKNGTTNPYSITPYDIWSLSPTYSSGAKYLSGCCYDDTNNRLFLAFKALDVNGFAVNPLIQVYEFV